MARRSKIKQLYMQDKEVQSLLDILRGDVKKYIVNKRQQAKEKNAKKTKIKNNSI